MNAAISIYEVGPRDGLQNLPKTIPLRKKVKLIRKLKRAGLKDIEIGSLVHPSVITMKDSGKLYQKTGGDLLIVNKKGLERAKELGANKLNIVISPSERFNKLNQNTTYEVAKKQYEEIVHHNPISRVYISCAFSPDVTEDMLMECIEWSNGMGNYVILCDTETCATRESVSRICKKAVEITPNMGIHFHLSDDTEDCIQSAYDSGVRIFDSSIAGLGGCFSIPSAQGNIATENLIFWATSKDIPIEQEIDIEKLQSVSRYALSLEYSKLERLANWIVLKVGVLI
jgi:hydroxymethylglutaryl-CoA lyase